MSCAATNCTNRKSKKMPGITFHKFPKDENQSAKWIKAIGRDQWKPSIHSLVCSKHFLEEMIDRTSLSCVRLREHAVPTIFETCSSEPKNKNQKCLAHKSDSAVTQYSLLKQSHSTVRQNLGNELQKSPSNPVADEDLNLSVSSLGENLGYESQKSLTNSVTGENSSLNLTNSPLNVNMEYELEKFLSNSSAGDSSLNVTNSSLNENMEYQLEEFLLNSSAGDSSLNVTNSSLNENMEYEFEEFLSNSSAGESSLNVTNSSLNENMEYEPQESRTSAGEDSSLNPNNPSFNDNLVHKSSIDNASIREDALKRKIKELEQHLENERKKVKLLQQKVRRQDKKIHSLEDLLIEMKNKDLVDDNTIDILSAASNVNREFLLRQLRKAKGCPLPNEFSPELKAFALTLNFFSTTAYDYVRDAFNKVLPHKRTISKWYEHINGEPGFTEEALKTIKLKIQNTNYPLLFALTFDEMCIRKHVEYDGHTCHGYVNFGASNEDDNLPLAKEAFTMIVVAINDNWKMPIGYFLVDKLNSSQKEELTQHGLSLLHGYKAKVVSATFDGLSSNLGMAKNLGCDLNPDSLKTTFPHPSDPGHEVAVFLDPCHMIKLIRNTFGEKKGIYDENNQLIDFEYVKALHSLQEGEGLHLRNKLRRQHVQYFNQKMKVALATQLLSNSVADAIRFCNERLKLESFKGSEATVRFIKMINDVFDVFNSRNNRNYGFKQAISERNYRRIFPFLQEAYRYISGLKIARDGPSILKSNRKTGFLGLLICIKSLIHLCEQLIISEAPLLKYLPTYKLSQDHIELFFSSIRFHGRNNNNPTARQFKGAYKKLLVTSVLRKNDKGNCIPLSDITILNVPSYRKPEEVINLSTPGQKLITQNDFVDTLDDHQYIFDAGSLSECSQQIIPFVAGFISRKLSSKLKCLECIAALIDSNPPDSLDFIAFKNKGGLIFPSEDVVAICKLCESAFRRFISSKKSDMINLLKIIAPLKSEILSQVLDKKYFKSLHIHQFDNDPMDNHLVHICKAIIEHYMKTRFSYFCKTSLNTKDSVRFLYSSLIKYKNQ